MPFISKSRNIITILIIATTLQTIIFACTQSEFPEYKKTKTGIYFKLHQINSNAKKADINDFLTIDIIYRTMADSIFFKARRKVQITKPEFDGSIDECFTMLYDGDSATFIIDAEDFFEKSVKTFLPTFFKHGDKMKVSVRVLSVKTLEEFEREKEEFLSWIEDFSEYEQILLKHFIEKEQISVDPTNSGLFHLTTKEGNGKKVKRGDTIVVNYEGRFLSGKVFDSTWKRNSAFSFVYGQEWQVIHGLEEAIGRMTEQEEAFFIMPSYLAFGNKGSSTGIIPPFTSVIFKVKLESINKYNIDSLILNP